MAVLPEFQGQGIGTKLVVEGVHKAKKHGYTSVMLVVVAAFFAIAVLLFREVLASLQFWLYLLFSFIGFLIFNHLLTSIPVVTYGSDAIWGVRVTTIPVEDFLYNISMLGFYFLVYWWARQRLSSF